MTQEEELIRSVKFMTDSIKNSILAIDRRLTAVEESVSRRDMFYQPPSIDDLREDIETRYGDLLEREP